MKRTILLTFVIVLLTACSTAPTQDPQTMVQTIVASTLTAHPTFVSLLATPTFPEPSTTATLFEPSATPTIPAATPTVVYEISEQDLYRVIAVPNAESDDKSDVYVHNVETGEEFFFISLAYVDREHYHLGEYHHGNLYIISRNGSEEAELRRFGSQGDAKLLTSQHGLDFRVSPDERYIAIKYNPNTSGIPSSEKLDFLQPQGKVKKKFDAKDLGELGGYYIKPLRWSGDSSYLWVVRFIGPKIYSFHRIEVSSWSISNYDVSSLPINDSSECDLNSNTAKIVFSDHPALFDTVNADNFATSGQVVTLYVYDFDDQQLQVIATSTAKEFIPKWVNENTIEYNDPNSNGRIVYVLP